MTIDDALRETFSTNFVTYYKAHAAHANITGRNFYSDHKLLEKVYEDLQEQIDTLAEFLRTVGAEMPSFIGGVLEWSMVNDLPFAGDSEDKLTMVAEDLETLVDSYEQLYETAEDEHCDISNYAQDRIRVLNKFIWMIESTVGEQDNDD